MMTSPRPESYENNSSVFSVYSVGSIFIAAKKWGSCLVNLIQSRWICS